MSIQTDIDKEVLQEMISNVNARSHWNGFRKEEVFLDLLEEMGLIYGNFKFKHLLKIVQTVHPEWVEGLFDEKTCVRKLRYIGNNRVPVDCDKPEFFVIDQEYESVTFNGGSYTIKGYPHHIGCNYFEVIPA